MKALIYLILMTSPIAISQVAIAGKLEEIRDDKDKASETKEKKKVTKKKRKKRYKKKTVVKTEYSDGCEEEYHSESDSIFFELLFLASYGIFIGGEDAEGETVDLQIPYSNHGDGWFAPSESAGSDYLVQMDYSLFRESEDLSAHQVSVGLGLSDRVNLLFDYDRFEEKTETFTDSLSVWQSKIRLNRVRTSNFVFHWDFGMMGFDNSLGVVGGAGFKIYPTKPVSCDSGFLWGSVAELSYKEFDAKMNYHLNRYYLQGGYTYYEFGDQVIKGPKIGIGAYF